MHIRFKQFRIFRGMGFMTVSAVNDCTVDADMGLSKGCLFEVVTFAA
jgi:hypothetical protein